MEEREKIREKLFNKGLIIEDYSKETDEFFKKVTDKGKKEIKEILKDPRYKEIFKEMVKEDIKETNPEFRIYRLNQIKDSVNSL